MNFEINIRAARYDNLHGEYFEEPDMNTTGIYTMVLLGLMAFSGCAPEVGSEAWCKKIAEKPKGELTANEAADYAKHCLFK